MNNKNLKKLSETDWTRIDRMDDEDIDTSDIPALDDEFFASAQLRAYGRTDLQIAIMPARFGNDWNCQAAEPANRR